MSSTHARSATACASALKLREIKGDPPPSPHALCHFVPAPRANCFHRARVFLYRAEALCERDGLPCLEVPEVHQAQAPGVTKTRLFSADFGAVKDAAVQEGEARAHAAEEKLRGEGGQEECFAVLVSGGFGAGVELGGCGGGDDGACA
eukprot:1642481-Rhodomonas_salina.1